jgi:hypothetical protein
LTLLISKAQQETDRFQATLHGFEVPKDELTDVPDSENGVSAEAIPEPPPTPTRAWLRGQQLAKERAQRAADIARSRADRGRAG